MAVSLEGAGKTSVESITIPTNSMKAAEKIHVVQLADKSVRKQPSEDYNKSCKVLHSNVSPAIRMSSDPRNTPGEIPFAVFTVRSNAEGTTNSDQARPV